MKYSNTAITQLTRWYKQVLIKCAIMNAAIIAGATMLATPAMAADTWTDAIAGTDAFMTTLEAGGWDRGHDPVTGWGVDQILGIMADAATNTDNAIDLVNDTTKGNEALYNDINVAADGDYISAGADVAGNLDALDTQVKANADAIDDIVDGTTAITYDNSTSGLTAATVQGAIDEVAGDITVAADGDYISAGADVAGNLDALDTQVKANADAIDDIVDGTTAIAYDNSTSGLTAATVQGAIDEVAGDITVAADGEYITAGADVAGNLDALDTQVKQNADDIADRKVTLNGSTGVATIEDGTTSVDVYTKDTADAKFVKADANNTFTGNNIFDGTVTMNQDVTMNADLTVNGATTLGDTTVDSLEAATLTTTGAAEVNSLEVTNGATVGGTLAVTGATTLSDTLAVTGATTLTGALSGSSASFTGDVETTGALKGGTLETTNGAEIGGDLTVAGDTSLENTEIDGTLEVTGDTTLAGLTAGDTTLDSLEVTGDTVLADLDVGGDLTVAGDTVLADLVADDTTLASLEVTGTSTFTGQATFGDDGFMMKDGNVAKTLNDGSAAVTSVDDADEKEIASMKAVLMSAEYAAYDGTTVKGATDSTTVKSALDETTAALNNVLIDDGSLVDDAKVYVEWNSADSTLDVVLGDGAYTSENNITAGDSITTALSSLDEAIGDRTYTEENNIESDQSVAESLDALDIAIGERTYTEENNIESDQSVAASLDALDVAIGERTYTEENNIESDQSVAESLDALDVAIGDRTYTNEYNIASDDSVTTSLDDIDAAIGDRSSYSEENNIESDQAVAESLDALDVAIGNRTYTNEYNIASDDSVTTSLDALDTAIGSRTYTYEYNIASNDDITTSLDSIDQAIGDRNIASKNDAINDGTASSLAEGLAAAGDAIGDLQLAQTHYASGDEDLTSAVRSLDKNVYRIDNEVKDLRKTVNRGFASMAAMSALVPNARANGNTQVSVGTGMYSGHAGFALGGFHWFTDNILMNVGVAYGDGDSSDMIYRAGVTYSW